MNSATALKTESQHLCRSKPEDLLIQTINELVRLRPVPEIIEIVKRAARELLNADGITFVLREGDQVFYAEEDAIAPLWKGRKFPVTSCISGWAILNKAAAVIEDIYSDPRIPHAVYRSTFVKSLAMVPVRKEDPIAAIGAYWANQHRPTSSELTTLSTLADAASMAILNDSLFREARKSIQVRNDFIGIAAHELRTPLTPIRIQLHLAARMAAKEGNQELVQLIRGADENALRMGALIENLLDLGQIMNGSIRLELAEVQVAQLLEKVITENQHQCKASGSEVALKVAPGLTTRLDRRKIERAVSNLIGNAIKFGQGKKVELEARAAGECLEISVRDQGIGISPEHHGRIFRKFERNVSSDHYGGFGMGLWIVKTFVEAHGGSVSVTSAPGQGSTFLISLPRMDSARMASEG